ncbi:MAG: cupin domain-containing protein [Pikeienuella sp.]|uniref:cupin domain-containing protein n=1 Tax=Pikeienuella sp. TaxID=2831957 RepID=UPI00391ACB07
MPQHTTETHDLRGDLEIGARLRQARELAGLRIRDLAQKVGCAESMVSKIESGKVTPSIVMLARLVAALGRDLASFFGSKLDTPGLVQRANERPILLTDAIRGGAGVSYERLVPFAAGNLLEANIHRVEPGGQKQDKVTHHGETLGYIVEGEIELTIETTTYRLSKGDSFFFKNHLTSSYRNVGDERALIFWVNTPQVH